MGPCLHSLRKLVQSGARARLSAACRSMQQVASSARQMRKINHHGVSISKAPSSVRWQCASPSHNPHSRTGRGGAGCWFVAFRYIFVAFRDDQTVITPPEESEASTLRMYESGPVQFPKNMTTSDVQIVALQQEGGFSTDQMKKIMT